MAVAGRPRSDESHKAILQAAYDLLAEGGLAAFTFERVAARAGVSRSTIYRWWPNKGALAMESTLGALTAELRISPELSPIEKIHVRLRRVAEAMKGPTGRIIAGMLAEGQQDPGTIASFTEGYLEPARSTMRALLRQAIDEGYLTADFDIETAMDVSFGTLYHQLLLRRSLEPDWVERLMVFMYGRALLR